ncbi:hypothetical protein PX701_09770 [Agromyces sp. H3Y2-19a]|uniref:hypothetical protein n=1 Tax=Agromyces chromiiresistens TaxID=3030835 RepID=UPI0023B94708|nr:hypothetical protein [Agromyces chromiiresistens]MDF0513905.1 hypothetical protein [Agromyces chromiiresistens]
MDTERLSRLGLEPVLTSSELAEYLGVHVQAIYDLRAAGRGAQLDGRVARPRAIRSREVSADGRPARLPIGTFGDVKTNQVGPGRFRAYARFRDWDGETR